MGSRGAMWRPIATIAAAARDVELEDPVLKLSGYSIYVNLVLNIFIFLGGGPTLNKVSFTGLVLAGYWPCCVYTAVHSTEKLYSTGTLPIYLYMRAITHRPRSLGWE